MLSLREEEEIGSPVPLTKGEVSGEGIDLVVEPLPLSLLLKENERLITLAVRETETDPLSLVEESVLERVGLTLTELELRGTELDPPTLFG